MGVRLPTEFWRREVFENSLDQHQYERRHLGLAPHRAFLRCHGNGSSRARSPCLGSLLSEEYFRRNKAIHCEFFTATYRDVHPQYRQCKYASTCFLPRSGQGHGGIHPVCYRCPHRAGRIRSESQPSRHPGIHERGLHRSLRWRRNAGKSLKLLENGTSAETIAGVGSFVEGKFEFVPPNLKEFPTSTANLGRWIDMKPYSRLGSSYTIQSKRGCRERCIYCVYQMIQGHRLRMRSPRDVVDEIEEAYHKFNSRDFEFIDSIFNDPEDHAVEVLEEICRRPWNANFSAIGMDPKGLNDKFLALMWKAGFRSFMLSPESACDTVIKNYGKGFAVDDLVRAAEAINKTRLTPSCFLVVGPETDQTPANKLSFHFEHLSTVNILLTTTSTCSWA